MTLAGGASVSIDHDNAVASAGASVGTAAAISFFFSGTCGPFPSLALVLLCVGSTGCFNPNLIGHPLPRDNHVPVVEVLPVPTLTPLDAVVELDQTGCAPLQFELTKLEDLDGDALTVRYDIVVNRDGIELRQRLKETPPIEVGDDGTYALPNGTSLDLDRTLLQRLGDLRTQATADAEVFQLIELRVSDNGFNDSDDVPVAGPGGGMFFISWNVKLSPCIGAGP